MSQHTAQLRPVVRDGDTMHALPLLREAWQRWHGRTPDSWMLWCDTCKRFVQGTEMAHTAGCDLDDLMTRRAEFVDWQARCRAAHQEHPAPRIYWVDADTPTDTAAGDTLARH